MFIIIIILFIISDFSLWCIKRAVLRVSVVLYAPQSWWKCVEKKCYSSAVFLKSHFRPHCLCSIQVTVNQRCRHVSVSPDCSDALGTRLSDELLILHEASAGSWKGSTLTESFSPSLTPSQQFVFDYQWDRIRENNQDPWCNSCSGGSTIILHHKTVRVVILYHFLYSLPLSLVLIQSVYDVMSCIHTLE